MISLQAYIAGQINESFKNYIGKDEIKKVAEEVVEIFNKSYAPIGGWGGSTAEDLLNENDLWMVKVWQKDGRIRAAAAYKNKQKGDLIRKVFACGTDGSDEGKNGLRKICKEDVERAERGFYAEVSGAMEHIYSKLGANPIANTLVADIIGKEIKLDADGYHYTRTIVGKERKKLLLMTGKKNNQVTNENHIHRPGLMNITESGINRILSHGKNGFIVVSANRSSVISSNKKCDLSDEFNAWMHLNSGDESTFLEYYNKKKDKELKKALKDSGYTYTAVYGGYKGCDGVTDNFEPSYIVYNANRTGESGEFNELQKLGIKLANDFKQDAIYVQAPNKAPIWMDQEGEHLSNNEILDFKVNREDEIYFTTTKRKKANPKRFTATMESITECFDVTEMYIKNGLGNNFYCRQLNRNGEKLVGSYKDTINSNRVIESADADTIWNSLNSNIPSYNKIRQTVTKCRLCKQDFTSITNTTKAISELANTIGSMSSIDNAELLKIIKTTSMKHDIPEDAIEAILVKLSK